MPAIPNSSVLGLDVGSQRIGVALASSVARLPHPLTTLVNDETFIDRLQEIITEYSVSMLIVGLPRNLNGQSTKQTELIELFVQNLREQITPSIQMQDEAVTSLQAEAELKARGKIYQKGDIDALAATYILEDFLNQTGSEL